MFHSKVNFLKTQHCNSCAFFRSYSPLTNIELCLDVRKLFTCVTQKGCSTRKRRQTGGTVKILFDGETIKNMTKQFTFKTDPDVQDVYTNKRSTERKNLKTFAR